MSGILAVPSPSEPAPALLHLHGGAQSARADIALAWARRGFVTLCPDWSVPAGTANAAHATRWPENIPPVHATRLEAGEATIGPLVRGVRRGISLLASLPELRPDRIAMVGISWGGLMTWLVNGTDSRLRTAIAVYGSGLSADRQASPSWLESFQPLNLANTQRAPVLHLNGTHDFFGKLDTSEALLKAVGPTVRRLYVPNEDHGLNETARACAHAWLDLHLRGNGDPPPEPDISPGPDKRFFHTASHDLRSVWREVSHGELPPTGRCFSTQIHANGLAFSSAVRNASPATHAPTNRLWDARADGLEGLFLRWELENLQIHTQATARLVLASRGVTVEPPQKRLCLFLRTDAAPPLDCNTLNLQVCAPVGSRVKVSIYNKPEIEDQNGFHAPEHLCGKEGLQEICLALSNFQPLAGNKAKVEPRDLHVLRLEFSNPKESPSDFILMSVDCT